MSGDLTVFLWLLKLGALVNLYFLVDTLALGPRAPSAHVVVPALILFSVSAYRCLFPNRYQDNVVLHDTVLSSTFATRLLATFSEVAYVYQLSHVIRLLNADPVSWVDALSWLMVAQVVASQVFVWSAILTGRLVLYYYEEIGWAVIFAANTIASLWLYTTVESLGPGELLVELSLLFGAVYLPWQLLHVRSLRADARSNEGAAVRGAPAATFESLKRGLARSIHERSRRTDAKAWGGLLGLTWMTAYWATLIPMWVHRVVVVFAGS